MTLSLYEITIPLFIHHLKTVTGLLERGIAFTKENGSKISEAQLAETKLIDDMGGLIYQIQRITDTAKGVAQRVGGVKPVMFDDKETTFPEIFKRIEKTIEILESVKPEHINAQEELEVSVITTKGHKKFIGKDYVLTQAIPNFYFHYATAYDLLRKEGVQIGKADFLGLAALLKGKEGGS